MGKKSLGRGLSAIFHDHDVNDGPAAEHGEGVMIQKIALSLIDTNPFQPRQNFDEDEIAELAATIREHGLIQPITVRRHQGRYQIVSGERRFRAATLLQLPEIECRVFEMLGDKTMAEWALIENIQRVDLNAIEVSQSYQQLIEHHGYTHEHLAERVGKSRSAVTNSLRLLKLPDQVRQWVLEGKLNAGQARSLLSPDIGDVEIAARKIIDGGLNAREAEQMARAAKPPRKSAPAAASQSQNLDPAMAQLVLDLQYHLGTKVRLSGKANQLQQGQIAIEYQSLEDLSRLRNLILGT